MSCATVVITASVIKSGAIFIIPCEREFLLEANIQRALVLVFGVRYVHIISFHIIDVPLCFRDPSVSSLPHNCRPIRCTLFSETRSTYSTLCRWITHTVLIHIIMRSSIHGVHDMSSNDMTEKRVMARIMARAKLSFCRSIGI